jgi:NAD(P)-dependent dehydrogenase (short-subunit alcohol dehydrogenase family)
MAEGSSFVVTGGGRGIGRAIAERLLGDRDTVVVLDTGTVDWADSHPSAGRILRVRGDATDQATAERAAELAASAAPLRGWVNNAAVFPVAWLHETPAAEVSALIRRNLDLTLTGCAAALRTFLTVPGEQSGPEPGGAIVNISSHQAQRAVRGALPYATAKAAIEGLTRALAVDYGPAGVRVNAIALGSIATERSDAYLGSLPERDRLAFHREISLLQPLGRMGRPDEVAEVAAFLLSGAASFLNGAIIPLDGGRSAVGRDPEEA